MTNFPGILIVLLLMLTFLGGVIGYCIALIVVKKAARKAIGRAHAAMQRERQMADPVLQKTKLALDDEHQPSAQGYDRSASERERALLEKSRMQQQHIQSLEVQVASLENQQERFQHHFASYKANKHRELVMALNASGSTADTDSLPTLSRKVDPATGQVADLPSLHIRSRESVAQNGHDAMGQPLSPELDIPTLSESELPESADDLEFDLSDSESAGITRGG